MSTKQHRTTCNLDEPLWSAWKATGLPMAEVIRRGLEGTGDVARLVAVEQRLALAEVRLSQVEARVPLIISAGAAEIEDPAAVAAEYDEHQRQRHEQVERAYDELWRQIRAGEHPAVVTVAITADLLGVAEHRARQVMRLLAHRGYAVQQPRAEGTGQPYRWTVRDPATVERVPYAPGVALY